MSDKRNENVNESNKKQKRRISWSRVGFLTLTLAFFIFICAVVFGYFQLLTINSSLADQVMTLEERATIDQQQLKKLRKLTFEMQQTMTKVQTLSNEQERLIADWKSAQRGDMSRWYMAEAQYLARLANDHVRYTGNIPSAIFLLQRAAQLLSLVHQPQAMAIRQALMADIARLQAMPQVNTTNLYLQLTSLGEQIDKMPLPGAPLGENVSRHAQSDLVDKAWWQKGLSRSWETLRQIVIIRQLNVASPPLVLPEQKTFLNQSLHSKLDSAMWAALHRNQAVYASSLSAMNSWIRQYYDLRAQETQTVLQQIDVLRKVNIKLNDGGLSTSLALFDKYFTPTRTT